MLPAPHRTNYGVFAFFFPLKSLPHAVSENPFQQPVWRAGGRSLGERQRKGALELPPPLPLRCVHLLTACPSRTPGPDGQKQTLCVLFRPFFPWDRDAQSCHAEGSGQPVAKHDRGTGGSCLSLSAAPEPGPVTAHCESARPRSTGVSGTRRPTEPHVCPEGSASLPGTTEKEEQARVGLGMARGCCSHRKCRHSPLSRRGPQGQPQRPPFAFPALVDVLLCPGPLTAPAIFCPSHAHLIQEDLNSGCRWTTRSMDDSEQPELICETRMSALHVPRQSERHPRISRHPFEGSLLAKEWEGW